MKTETPWEVRYDRDGIAGALARIGKMPHASITEQKGVNRDQANANAAFIVKAVNCHEELLKALKVAQRALQYWGDKAESYEKANDPMRLDAHAKVWEAIAKAEASR